MRGAQVKKMRRVAVRVVIATIVTGVVAAMGSVLGDEGLTSALETTAHAATSAPSISGITRSVMSSSIGCAADRIFSNACCPSLAQRTGYALASNSPRKVSSSSGVSSTSRIVLRVSTRSLYETTTVYSAHKASFLSCAFLKRDYCVTTVKSSNSLMNPYCTFSGTLTLPVLPVGLSRNTNHTPYSPGGTASLLV